MVQILKIDLTVTLCAAIRLVYKFCMRLSFTLILFLASLASAQTPQQLALDRDASTLLEQDFIAFNPHYTEEHESRVTRTMALAKRMYGQEANGGKNACGHQVLFELGSLLISSADFKVIDARLHDLEANIGHSSSDKQDADGMWGACYQEWYLKLYATYDHLEASAGDDPAPHPLPAFLARLSTPDKLTAYLDALSVSDVRPPAGGPRQAANWPELTESEFAVVSLVARGAANREVAERLFLSPYTVSSHLRHVFTKLGIRSRAELAHIATARGLPPSTD